MVKSSPDAPARRRSRVAPIDPPLTHSLSLPLSPRTPCARCATLRRGSFAFRGKRGLIFFQKKPPFWWYTRLPTLYTLNAPDHSGDQQTRLQEAKREAQGWSEEGGGHVQVWFWSREASGVWGFIVAFGVVRGPASLRVVTSRAGPRRCSERWLRRRPSFVLYCPNTSADARVRGAEEEGIPQQEGHEGEPPFEEDQVQENVLVLRKVRRGFGSTPNLLWDIEGDVHLFELAQTRSRGGGELRRL